jgi:class 3 adenylate cyclase/tetratricopeptide (TPR) repeat protein
MFCDLVGSTELSTKLDPEDLRELITSFQDHCRGAIQHYEGFIARYMGDGLLVYFGYPQAHEDDAERAVRAGLDVVGSMADLNAKIGKAHGVVLAARIGIATGPVVVGDLVGEGAAEEAAVVGETPNRAARLQGVAQPNQVVIGPMVRRLLGNLFELKDLGQHELKGIAEPVQVWRVVRQVDTHSRDEARRVGSAMPLVGRQEELGLLMRSWEASKEGRGQAVLIQGEAGIGKSRLVDALRERVSPEGHTWITARCSPYHANSTLYPIIEHLKRVVAWKPEDGAEEKLEKLEKSLKSQNLPLEEAVPLYADLMSLPLPEGRYAPLGLNATQQREQTLDALAGWLFEHAEQTPVIHVWEDLHWADPTTLELLGIHIEQSPTVSMLNVLTYRPEFEPPWSMHSHMTPITLNRMERPEVEALIENQAAGKSIPPEVIEHVVSKADGVPLYVEELTKTILGSELLAEDADQYVLMGALSDVRIPVTLQDSLMARLDRLPTLREVAQLGAVIGREFAYEMLRSLADVDEPALQDGLGQLVESELLYQRGRPPRSRYIFKHALIQDAAYHSLLKRTRQQYHQQVAELMKGQLLETVEAQPELLAHHYSEAGSHEQAVEYWHAAGRRAAERSANAESIAHLKRGLEEIRMLPETSEQLRKELEIQTSLGPVLIATMGYGAQEVKDTYTRAKALCDQVGSKLDRFPVLRGLWNSYLFRAEMHEARERGEELLRLAKNIGDSSLVVEAHRVMGTVSFMMGDFVNARDHAERGIEVYDPDQHRELAFVYGADPSVVCGLYGAKALWMLGYQARALATMDSALSRVRELSHSHTEAFALCYQASLRQYCRDIPFARDSAKAAVDVASKLGIRQWLAWATILLGWSEVFRGEQKEGILRLQEGLDQWRPEDLFAVPYFLGLKAEALAEIGQVDEALETLAASLEVSGEGEQWFYAPELHRLRGDLLLQKERVEEAEESLQQALYTARRQQARSLELRAAMSLGRLWRQQGKVGEARKILSEIHGWFSKESDGVDLKETESLLEGLGPQSDVRVS